MHNMRRSTFIHVLIISIFSLVLFTCPFAYAQSHQLADEYWDKANDKLFLKLYYEKELPPEEIVEILSITVNTVYSKKKES